MDGAEAKKTFKSGEVIMRQGDKGDCAYIIEEGQVEIIIERPEGIKHNVGTRGPGTIIGEMAIVDDAPRTATVKAIKDCKLVQISRGDYAMRLKNTDPVIQMISQVILTRYRDTLTRAEILRESESWPPAEMLERDYTAATDVVESIRIANEFKAALENGELEMHYQPIINLAKGDIVGFEALMRWIHPEKGFISPAVFIPIAEQNGFIVEASKWALEESAHALRRIETQLNDEGRMYVSVNFSSHDFAEADFLSTLMGSMKRSGLTPPQLKLEITERLLIQQPENAKAMLRQCRDEGFGIAIDDFGTGYSSLSYLYCTPSAQVGQIAAHC